MRGPTQGTAIKVYESLAWLDEVKRVAAMLAAMDVDPLGIEYAGDRANGIVIDHRFADSWLVSFRPTGPGRRPAPGRAASLPGDQWGVGGGQDLGPHVVLEQPHPRCLAILWIGDR